MKYGGNPQLSGELAQGEDSEALKPVTEPRSTLNRSTLWQ